MVINETEKISFMSPRNVIDIFFEDALDFVEMRAVVYKNIAMSMSINMDDDVRHFAHILAHNMSYVDTVKLVEGMMQDKSKRNRHHIAGVMAHFDNTSNNPWHGKSQRLKKLKVSFIKKFLKKSRKFFISVTHNKENLWKNLSLKSVSLPLVR